MERVRRGFGSGLLRTAYVSDRGDVYSHLVTLLLDENRVAEMADGAKNEVYTNLQELKRIMESG